MSWKEVFNKNQYFFVPYLILLFILIFPLILFSKSSLHILINEFHSPLADLFFKYITNLGDGLFAVVIAVLFLFVSFRKALFILLSYLSSGLLVQVLKRFFFPYHLRPVKFFEGTTDLHLIEGIKMNLSVSFPSGHATTAFSLFLCLAVISKNNTVKFFCFVIAAFIAFSRVYLSQHFLIDVYAGSMIGVSITLLLSIWIFKLDKTWLDKRILR